MHQLVPTFILQKIDAGEYRGEFKAAAMFADLSGFSSMADALGKLGHHGSEMLAALMQSVFEPLVSSVYAQGGFVVGFAGDSITALFLDDSPVPPALRCISAAAQIQNHFAEHTTYTVGSDSFKISIKIGLSYGDAIWEIFRSADERKATYCFRGEALETSALAEHRARPGELWLHDSIYKQAGELNGNWQDDFFKLETFTDLVPELPLPGLSSQALHVEEFFSEAIINLTHRGEFRPVVNVFIDISLDVQQGDNLATFIETVFSLQELYGGFFLRPDFGDKGANLLIFWGAPVAYENDIERALNFLLALQSKIDMPFSAGVSYRLAYSGFIGAKHREDYTSYGWGIALAARMMKSARKGEIWVDGEVAQRVSDSFKFSEPEARNFKGFATKQNVYLLTGRNEAFEEVFRGAFEGRSTELKALNDFVSPLWQTRFAGIMIVKGDPGAGKSRLVHEFKVSEKMAGREVQWAFCQAEGIIRNSLNPIRYWLRNRFALDTASSDEENRERFFRLMDKIAAVTPDKELRGELLRTRSFIGALLNIYWEGSLFSQLDAKERYQNTFIALSVLLRCESLQHPLILHLDDAHWADDDTRDFLPYLVRTLTADESRHYPIAILATMRPEGEPVVPVDAFSVRELFLGGLDEISLTQISSKTLGGPVSPALVEFLGKRAEGNPFFVEQVLQYLIENNLVSQRNGIYDMAETGQVDLLSTDIQSILVARLDRLTREVREVVQSAAVLGREFEIRLLAAMLHDEGLAEKVHQAEVSDIWVPLTEIRYIFRHALMRDAAYSMQLRSRQRQLHGLAVDALEKLYADDLSPYYGELAYHSERAYQIEKARKYLELAGDFARDQYQNSQALDHYKHALRFTPENELEKRYQLHLNREKILAHWDQREEQVRELDILQTLADTIGDKEKLVQARLRRVNHVGFLGDYRLARDLAEEALTMSQQIERYDLVGDAYLLICDALFHQGLFGEAIERGNAGVDLARAHGLTKNEAQLLNMIGMAMLETEPGRASAYFEQAREIFKKMGDISNLLMPTNNLGQLAGMRADFSTAKEYFEEALALTREIGNRKGESALLNNLGWIAGLQGDYRKARLFSERNLLVCREAGERYTEIYTLINLSSYAEAMGDFDSAIKYAEQGLDLARQSGEASGEAWALTYLGHTLFGVSQFERAQEMYGAAIGIRQELDQGVLETEPAAGSARTALVRGDESLARDTVERVLAFIQKDASLEGTDQPIRVYLNCYLVLTALNDPRAASILEQGYQMLNARAAGIANAAAREMFLEGVSFHREIMSEWQARHPKPV
jgi:predicted ATPase/class 3 adenylate cyclase